ncbi:hypothetical protein Zmor_001588 [Zophobas morio]|uniref:Uncharacterized protein n=1 Tax=Zophobas morio TaxID=2755281 RepID=A0AA38J9I2_9CUCU|nr:hypothetical protein Zmor_001588 [Zophobas morio]
MLEAMDVGTKVTGCTIIRNTTMHTGPKEIIGRFFKTDRPAGKDLVSESQSEMEALQFGLFYRNFVNKI